MPEDHQQELECNGDRFRNNSSEVQEANLSRTTTGNEISFMKTPDININKKEHNFNVTAALQKSLFIYLLIFL